MTGRCKFGEGCLYIHPRDPHYSDSGPCREIRSRAAGARPDQSVNLNADTNFRPVSDRERTPFSETSSSGDKSDGNVKKEDCGKVSDGNNETFGGRVYQKK
jgi:hypothetical protein